MAARSPPPGRATELTGRRGECAALDGFVEAVRAGESAGPRKPGETSGSSHEPIQACARTPETISVGAPKRRRSGRVSWRRGQKPFASEARCGGGCRSGRQTCWSRVSSTAIRDKAQPDIEGLETSTKATGRRSSCGHQASNTPAGSWCRGRSVPGFVAPSAVPPLRTTSSPRQSAMPCAVPKLVS